MLCNYFKFIFLQVENKREEEFTHLLVNINLTACTIP